MESPFTGKEMILVSLSKTKKSDRYFKCIDTNALFLSNSITKADIQEGLKLAKELLERMKA